jgi:microcystin-dependent protein
LGAILKSLIASLRSLTLPFGATSGTRIVLDGVNGVIQIYDENNLLRGEIGIVGGDESTIKLFTEDASEEEPAKLISFMQGLPASGTRNLVLDLRSPVFPTRSRSLIELLSESFDGTEDTRIRYFGGDHDFESAGDADPVINVIGTDSDYRLNGVSILMPTGAIIPYGGASGSPPDGWLDCNGQAVSRTTFADLFAVLGTAYGAGDGSTTFNVPDLRQRFPLGVATAGTGSTRGGTGGSIDHVHAGPSHTHSLETADGASAHAKVSISSVAPELVLRRKTVASWTETHNMTGTDGVSSDSNTVGTELGGSTDDAGTGDTDSDNPPFQAVNYLIKT